MSVRDRDIDKTAKVVEKTITFQVDEVGNGVSAATRGQFKPGFAFEVVGVQCFARDVTAQASVDVQIGSTSVLSAAIDLDATGDATRADGTLSATLASRRGSASDVISVKPTTDGGGDISDLTVYVTLRARGHRGD